MHHDLTCYNRNYMYHEYITAGSICNINIIHMAEMMYHTPATHIYNYNYIYIYI